MAMTAWETYVEDRIQEEVQSLLRVLNGSHAGKFMESRLEEELRRLHNPTAEKTRKLFLDFLNVDVTTGWKWQTFDPKTAKATLDELLSKRGDAVHRSRTTVTGAPEAPHPVRKDDLEKAIRFLKGLVEATDKVLEAT